MHKPIHSHRNPNYFKDEENSSESSDHKETWGESQNDGKQYSNYNEDEEEEMRGKINKIRQD